jgi:hypothetical protein
MFANELARREAWLCSNSLHPGVIDTKLLHTGFNIKGDSISSGARTSLYLATSDEVKGITGKYFDHCSAIAASPVASDRELSEALWRWSENAVHPSML